MKKIKIIMSQIIKLFRVRSMGKDQMIGGLLCAGSIAGILIYAWILFFTEWTLILLQLTALIA